MRQQLAVSLIACIALGSACSDSAGPPAPPPVGGARHDFDQKRDSQSAYAGTALASPAVVVPLDDQSRTVPNQHATFTVLDGSGAISSTTERQIQMAASRDQPGRWARSAVPQQLLVTIGSKTATVSANVRTNYKIDVRFFEERCPRVTRLCLRTRRRDFGH